MLKRAFGSTVTVFSTFRIGTGTDTPAATNTGLQTGLTAWATGGVTYKPFITGYPTYNTTDRTVTWRGQVSSTEANGNTLTEVAEFNTDGTPVIGSRTVFTGIVKSSSVQIIMEIKHKMT
jgi:hypothetical protein